LITEPYRPLLEVAVDIEQYIIDRHREIITAFLDAGEFNDALDAVGRLADFYLGCMPDQPEEKWK
jgi:hypothetical protein